MREIEFRGKSVISGKWVYGWLDATTEEDGEHYWIDQCLCAEGGINCAYQVDTETVGQYTGLKDKNGKKIFEGDIVKTVTIDEKETRYGVVKFGKYKDINFEDSCCGFYVESKGIQLSIFNGEADGYCLTDMVEVAGNIWDNKELLEEQNAQN